MTEDELAYGQKTKSFEAWKGDATTMMPWPSDGDIMKLILCEGMILGLIGSLVGSALIGWCIDRWFSTTPWALIVMLFLGLAVAFRHFLRIAGGRPD